MSDESIIANFLDNQPIKNLIERIRKTQIWKKDLINKSPKDDYTVDLWLSELGLAPGPHKVRAMIVYENYRDFCKSKKINDISIININKLGAILKRDRVFPKHVAADQLTYYHLNKDINTEAERERQKAKQEKKRQRKKEKNKSAMGTKTSDI